MCARLSGQEHDAAAAERGAVVYEEQCGFCHGEAGEGMAEVGAPNLADAIWLYGGTHEEIVAQISKPRQGVMPAWGARLGEDDRQATGRLCARTRRRAVMPGRFHGRHPIEVGEGWRELEFPCPSRWPIQMAIAVQLPI